MLSGIDTGCWDSFSADLVERAANKVSTTLVSHLVTLEFMLMYLITFIFTHIPEAACYTVALFTSGVALSERR